VANNATVNAAKVAAIAAAPMVINSDEIGTLPEHVKLFEKSEVWHIWKATFVAENLAKLRVNPLQLPVDSQPCMSQSTYQHTRA
jgi:hypothetical protein